LRAESRSARHHSRVALLVADRDLSISLSLPAAPYAGRPLSIEAHVPNHVPDSADLSEINPL